MVRCADCGFLANRNFETGELVSVDEGRQTGRFRTLPGVTYGPVPTCFRMKANLFAEYLAEKSENRLLAVIAKDRGECAGFVKWEPGFTPKEHREMLFDLERKKLEIQEKEGERRWEERRDKRERRFQLFNTLISALAGVLFTAVVGGVVAWIMAEKGNGKPPNLPPASAAPSHP